SARWHQADVAGLLLQLAFAAACLVLRIILVLNVALVLGYFTTLDLWSPAAWLAALVDLPLLPSGTDGGDWACLALATWHTFEGIWMSRYFERLRQLPARRQQLPAPVTWRLDAFDIAWWLQAAVLWAVLISYMATQIVAAGMSRSPV